MFFFVYEMLEFIKYFPKKTEVLDNDTFSWFDFNSESIGTLQNDISLKNEVILGQRRFNAVVSQNSW